MVLIRSDAQRVCRSVPPVPRCRVLMLCHQVMEHEVGIVLACEGIGIIHHRQDESAGVRQPPEAPGLGIDFPVDVKILVLLGSPCSVCNRLCHCSLHCHRGCLYRVACAFCCTVVPPGTFRLILRAPALPRTEKPSEVRFPCAPLRPFSCCPAKIVTPVGQGKSCG